MSTLPAVTMEDLELEHAELLPGRETLWCCHSKHCCAGGSSVETVNQYQLVGLQIGVINL